MMTAATGAIHASCGAMIASTTTNSKKKGRSTMVEMVEEVTISRICSSSRSWEIKLPVERGMALLRRRRAWPKTRSETRRSERLPSRSMMCPRATRSTKPNSVAISTPMVST